MSRSCGDRQPDITLICEIFRFIPLEARFAHGTSINKVWLIRHTPNALNQSARNPIIVDVLRDYGYVDARGMGVRRKFLPLVRAASGREPHFGATENALTVILPHALQQGS